MNAALGIEARRVVKEYAIAHGGAAKRAIDGLTFTIAEGERVGLIGRNGAGKTTLLQLLAGIAEPSGGELVVNGHVTAIFTLGMGLRDDLSGRENVYVEGELLGRTREQTDLILDRVIDFAELGDFIDRPVRTYSTGMKARLAFSTIVHIEPEILIIDEALSVGDAHFAAKATAKMRELASQGRILILVSHSMSAIQHMCTRCLWIDAGRIRMDGAPQIVTQAYLDEVRRADEALLSVRFRRELVDESLAPGWRVRVMEVQGPEQLAAVTLATGQAASLLLAVDGVQGAAFEASLTLMRLDGLLVLQSSSGDAAQSLAIGPDGARGWRIDFGQLPLNLGLYKAELEVTHCSRPVARRSVLFEVIHPSPHSGGRPVLDYPCTISSTRIET